MVFLNPYDIAEKLEFEVLKTDNLKKFKRILFAELELNDNEIEINDKNFTKSDCIEIINIIDNSKDSIEHYKNIYNNEEMNKLLYGIYTEKYIEEFGIDLIFEAENFINFISPYLTHSIKQIYKKAFLNNNSKILSSNLPLDDNYLEEIYNSVYKLISERSKEVRALKDERFTISKINRTVGLTETINSLPEYFDKVKDDLMMAIRSLFIESFNNLKDNDLTMEIINYVLQFNFEGKAKSKILEDKEIIENSIKKSEYIDVIYKIEEILEDLESDNLNANQVYFNLKNAVVSTKPVDEIGQILRSIAITLCNDYEEYDESLRVIRLAIDFTVSSEFKNKFLKDKDDISNILKDYKYEKVAKKIVELNDDLSKNYITPISALTSVKSSINGLNKNDTIALVIRNLSISSINKCDDIETAYKLNELAKEYVVSDDLRKTINLDYEDLKEIEKNRLCFFCKRNEALDEKYYETQDIWKYEETGLIGSVVGVLAGRRYYTKTLPIPTCKSCYNKHKSYGMFSFSEKKELRNKKEKFINQFSELSSWSLGSSPKG